MYTPIIAEQLRTRGHDALAVNEVPDLKGVSDEALLEWAAARGRAILTENVGDFLALHGVCLRTGTRHSGIVLASNAAFPRAKAATVGALIRALDRLLAEVQVVNTDIRWLQPAEAQQ
jgi:hypothetical protein